MLTASYANIARLVVVLASCRSTELRNTPSVPQPSAVSAADTNPGRRAPVGDLTEITPFTIDVTPSLQGSRTGIIRTGESLVTGDSIQVAVKSSVDAHLYLGYCDRNNELMIFPKYGSIEAKAGEIAYAPHRDARITFDDQAGAEVLYVIASRKRLDVADPELAAAISHARPGTQIVDCGPPLQSVIDKRAKQLHDSGGHAVRPKQQEDARTPPPARLDRGGFLRWSQKGAAIAGEDRDGIIILRYSFSHLDR